MEIGRWRAGRPHKDRLQDAPGFGLHRMTVLFGADTQPYVDRRVEVADRDAAHRCSVCRHDVIVIDDRSDGKTDPLPAAKGTFLM